MSRAFHGFNQFSSWWVRPSVVYIASLDRTYFGNVSATGGIMLGYVDHANMSTAKVELHDFTTPDDHDTPAIAVPDILADGLLVFFADHSNEQYLRFRKVDTDLAPMAAVQTIDFGVDNQVSYAQVFIHDGVLTVFCRVGIGGSNEHYFFVRSDDWGATWTAPVQVFDFGLDEHCYMLGKQRDDDPSIVDFALWGHPEQSTLANVWIGQLDLDTDAITSDGVTVGNLDGTDLPVPLADLDIAYAPATGRRGRLHDIIWTGSALRLAMSDWATATDVAEYYIVDGGNLTELVAAGDIFGHTSAAHYHGGMAFVPNGVVLAREADGMWHVEEWKASGGWTLNRVLDRSVTTPLVRPRAVAGDDGAPFDVFWHEIVQYAAYTNFKGHLRAA